METLLAGLRAAAEPTRLRLLALCARSELTVSELTQILGQSQPRISRHLKLMCEAGLLERFREGSWAFFRVASRDGNAELARRLGQFLDTADPILELDRTRLNAVRAARSAVALRYFSENAEQWGRIRALHIDEAQVERAVVRRLGPGQFADFLDIGTGTGRLLELCANLYQRGLGIDLSREMLAVARANLERAGLRHASVRQADLYQLPVPTDGVDGVVMHQVLHFLEAPARAIAEAARVLRPGGRLVVVDFAPHQLEELRDSQAHRRLGFAADEVQQWLAAAGLDPEPPEHLPSSRLTVTVWSAVRPPAAGAVGAITVQRPQLAAVS